MTKVISVNGTDVAFEISDSTFKPYRKKPTLAIIQGNEVIKVASFNNTNSMLFTINVLEKILNVIE